MPVGLWEFIQRDAERQGVTPNDIVKQAFVHLSERRKAVTVTFSAEASKRIRRICEDAELEMDAFCEDQVMSLVAQIEDGQFHEFITEYWKTTDEALAVRRAEVADRWDGKGEPSQWYILKDDEGYFKSTAKVYELPREMNQGFDIVGVVLKNRNYVKGVEALRIARDAMVALQAELERRAA